MLGYVVSGCSYIGTTLKQTGFLARFSEVPSQKIYKHMLKTDKFFVYGKIFNGIGLNQQSLAIVAISNEHQQGEMVDASHFTRLDSFYGLHLPAGYAQPNNRKHIGNGSRRHVGS